MFEYTIDLFKKANINLPKQNPYDVVEDMCRNGEIGYIDAQGMRSVSLDNYSLSLSKPILIDNLGQFTLLQPKIEDSKERVVVDIHRVHTSGVEWIAKGQYLRIIPSTGKYEKVDAPKTRWDKILSVIRETGTPVVEYPGINGDETIDIESYRKQRIPLDQLYKDGKIPLSYHKTVIIALYGVEFLWVNKFGECQEVYCIKKLTDDLSPMDALSILRSLLEEKFPIDPSLYNMYDIQFSRENDEETRRRELENYS